MSATQLDSMFARKQCRARPRGRGAAAFSSRLELVTWLMTGG